MRKICAAVLAGALGLTLCGCHIEYKENITLPADETETADAASTINVRYSDDTYTSFFEYCKTEFEKNNKDTTVNLQLVSSENYIQTISDDSISGDNISDVYMLTNSSVGTAYLAGLAAKNAYVDKYTSNEYADTAINACSYNQTLVAYPLGYSTSFLIYNKDIVGDADISSFAAIKTYSDALDLSTDENASIENIFSCNITDLFLNYGFIGAGINIGGKYGNDPEDFSIDNDKAVACAGKYSELIDYFSLNSNTAYDSCIDSFLAGKIIFTVMSTDSLDRLSDATVNYGITALPDYDDENKTSPLSITTALAVNPYSANQKLAAEFAWFASYAKAVAWYDYTGTLSTKSGIAYDEARLQDIYKSYEKSTAKNKLQYGEQVYPLIEIALHNIAAGNDIATELANVDEYMTKQLK